MGDTVVTQQTIKILLNEHNSNLYLSMPSEHSEMTLSSAGAMMQLCPVASHSLRGQKLGVSTS